MPRRPIANARAFSLYLARRQHFVWLASSWDTGRASTALRCRDMLDIDAMPREDFPQDARQQRRILAQVLTLNVLLSASLVGTGICADSSGLMANGLDNASDSAVYTISYVAVGRSARLKTMAASISGAMLLVLALAVLGDAVRRFVVGAEPVSTVMVAMGVVAVTINVWCLRLLRPLRGTDVNLRAAYTFSANDFISNIGVLIAAGLVA